MVYDQDDVLNPTVPVGQEKGVLEYERDIEDYTADRSSYYRSLDPVKDPQAEGEDGRCDLLDHICDRSADSGDIPVDFLQACIRTGGNITGQSNLHDSYLSSCREGIYHVYTDLTAGRKSYSTLF